MEDKDTVAIKAAHTELNTHMQKIEKAMQSAQPAPDAQQPPKNEKENIEEAEVEILDDEDKK